MASERAKPESGDGLTIALASVVIASRDSLLLNTLYSEGLFGLTEAAEEAATFEDTNEPSKSNGWFYISFNTLIFIHFVNFLYLFFLLKLMVYSLHNQSYSDRN